MKFLTSTMFPFYRRYWIGFYNVVESIRYNGNRNLAYKRYITLRVSISFQQID